MPFVIGSAVRHTSYVTLDFSGQTLGFSYNTGEKYLLWQKAAANLEQRLLTLSRRLELGDVAVDLPENATLSERREAEDKAIRELYSERDKARRQVADNLCIVIEEWDLETNEDFTLDDIKARMSKPDQKKNQSVTGVGLVPISGEWLDALPFDDKFLRDVGQAIEEDFAAGGKGTKKG